jgi:hypothetical protein
VTKMTDDEKLLATKICNDSRERVAQKDLQTRITTPEHIEKIRSKWAGFIVEAKLKEKNT